MAKVFFTVNHTFQASPRVVWDELVDWAGHANWIPATRVDVEDGDQQAIGARFTAWTGYGPLTLEDKMQVAAIEWSDETNSGACTVEKLGPVLSGTASFTIEPGAADETKLVWIEDVRVPYVPQFLAPIVNRLGAGGFKIAMISLARHMRKSSAVAAAM